MHTLPYHINVISTLMIGFMTRVGNPKVKGRILGHIYLNQTHPKRLCYVIETFELRRNNQVLPSR